jgi:hypothetical protein
MSLIKALSCPDLTSNGFSVDPENKGSRKAAIARQRALYEAQIGRILANGNF